MEKSIGLKKFLPIGFILILLVITGLLHGINMFNYPGYGYDEGTYMAQAWSVTTEARLEPYTYWYDHPPLAWVQIAIWTELTGGFEHFGMAINSGRVLMLIFSVLTTVLIFLIIRKLKVVDSIAFLGALIYAISPMVIYYSRMVFIDNIMIFWVLLSITIILYYKSIKAIFLSALCFGIGFLSKEVGLIFIIPIILLIYFETHTKQRKFTILLWIFVSCLVISSWVLYALLKGELFPMGTLLGGHNRHVSLISTIIYQMSRKGNGTIFNAGSNIRTNLVLWSSKYFGDPILIVGGIASSVLNLLFYIIKRNYYYLIFPIFTIMFFLFFGRGGQVYDYYIIPLLPFLIINIVLLFSETLRVITQILKTQITKNIVKITVILLSILVFVKVYKTYMFPRVYTLLTGNQTITQIKTVQWISKNIPKQDVIVTDTDIFVDLKYQGFYSPNPIWVFKADLDPAIRYGILHNNWKNIDYMVTDPTTIISAGLKKNNLNLLNMALMHSKLIKVFSSDGHSEKIYKVIK